MLRAVPAMIFIADSKSIAFKSGILYSAISFNFSADNVATSVVPALLFTHVTYLLYKICPCCGQMDIVLPRIVTHIASTKDYTLLFDKCNTFLFFSLNYFYLWSNILDQLIIKLALFPLL